MLNDKNESGTFLIGTLIGGLLGTATALLLAPKSGSKLRQDLSDKCCEMSDAVQNWELLKSTFQEAEKPPVISKNMIIGGIIGGGLAAATSLLLAPKVGKNLRKNIADAYQEIADSDYISQLSDLNPFQKPTKLSKLKSLLKQKRK
jgi:gas vesicle protein